MQLLVGKVTFLFIWNFALCIQKAGNIKFEKINQQPPLSLKVSFIIYLVFSYGQNHSTQNEAYKQNFMIILGTFGQLCVFFVFWRQWGWCVCKEMQDTMTLAILSIDWIVDVVVLFIAC